LKLRALKHRQRIDAEATRAEIATLKEA